MQVDPVTLAITGAFPFVLIAAALLTFVASLLLLRRYRRAVMRGMDDTAGAAATPSPLPPGLSPTTPLQLQRLAHSAAPAALVGPWPAALVYAAAGVSYALVMTLALVLAENLEPVPMRLLFLGWAYLWPTVLSINLVAATGRGVRLATVGGYAAVWALLAAAALARNPGLDAVSLLQHWLLTNAAPTLLVGAFMLRRIRAVGPLLLALALPALLGSQLAVTLLGANDQTLRAAVVAGSALGLGGVGLFWLTMALGFGIFALLAWGLLRRLGRRYAAGALSDEMLMLDALWLLFALTQPIGLAFVHWAWWGAGLLAFAAWRGVARFGLRRLKPAARPRTLLLLRVFALGARSATLFDALRRRWLRGGPIVMIAGPDLVTSAVEPHEFLDYLSGQLGRRFVSGEADLAQRVAVRHVGAGPDGRHRVDEFFCHADTWQPTMRRLVSLADAVLMDLRSFSPSNQGCVWELGRLLDTLPLSRVVFVVDRSTDQPFLESTLQRLWSALADDSPNRGITPAVVRLFDLGRGGARAIEALVAQLTPAETGARA